MNTLRRYSSARYFLYRNEPFRILYMEAQGFCEPPRNNEDPRRLRTWWFLSLETAKAVAKSCSAQHATFVGDQNDFKRLKGTEYSPPPPRAFVELAMTRELRTYHAAPHTSRRPRETKLEDLI